MGPGPESGWDFWLMSDVWAATRMAAGKEHFVAVRILLVAKTQNNQFKVINRGLLSHITKDLDVRGSCFGSFCCSAMPVTLQFFSLPSRKVLGGSKHGSSSDSSYSKKEGQGTQSANARFLPKQEIFLITSPEDSP